MAGFFQNLSDTVVQRAAEADALASQIAAAASEASALASKDAAAASAVQAGSSATSSASDVNTTAASATASEVSNQASLAAKAAALIAQAAAETAEGNAAGSESNSAASSASAAASATASEASKVISGTSAATATTKAAESAASAVNAAASAATTTSISNASETARAASVVAKDASVAAKDAAVVAKDASVVAKTASETAETNSAASETAAGNSATAASTSAATATTKAAEASTSAATATTKSSDSETARAASVVAKDASVASASAAATSATAAASSALISSADRTKLDGIESGATADQTAAQLLIAIKTVDGAGTGLDADLLDGQQGSYYTAYTDTAVANLVDSSPGALNTLNELAAALGDDSSFSTSVTNSIATKAALSGAEFTGGVVLNTTGSVKVPVGTTAQRDASPAVGMFRYSSTTNSFEGYADGSWGEIGGGAADLRVNSFLGTGSQVNFTLTSQPLEKNTLIYIDGVYQNKSGYSINGYVLSLSSAPDNGATIEIIAATVAPVQESTDWLINQYTGNNSTTAFSLSNTPTSENQCSVFISGVYQSKANFSVSGSTLSFSTPPPSGSAIEVMVARTVVFGIGVPDNNTVSTVKIQDDAVTSAKVDSTVATVAGTETLTNKTLTAPDINTPDIDGGTIDGTVIGGATPAAISGTSGSFDVTADGAIVTYKKSGTTVGSIGTGYGVVDIKGGTSGLLMGNTAVLPVNGSGTLTTDSYDIGAGSYRFKDLYLSGGVVFGPASASNVSSQTLDSYEEGSFTATLTATTAPSTAQTQTCYYTKIGNLVNVFIRFTNKNTTGASGGMTITGLPFTSSSNDTNNASTPMLYNLTISDKYVSGYVGASTSFVGFLNNRTNLPWTSTQINANAAVYLNMNLAYQVA